jgi:hydrogenase-4 component F
MTLDALAGVLGIPLIAAALFAAVPNYRIAARSNIAATGLTLICALSLFFVKPEPGAYLLVDDLNGTFIVLTTFVGFTTSIFSATALRALLSRDVSSANVCDESCADSQQYRLDVGGD